jgi:drug/metabolite transporter (DMT)-like permease
LKRGGHQSPVPSNAIGATVGCAFCLTVSMFAGETHAVPRSFAELFPIVYLTLAGSIGAYVLLTWLVNYWDVTKITYISVIVPIVALVLGTVVRHEHISRNAMLGSVLVLIGVLLRIRADRVRAPAQKSA